MSRCLSLLVLLLGLSSHLVHAETYKVTGSIPIGGTGHWDYLLADSENRRLYVSHNAEVVVLDLDSQKILGKVPVGGFSHGIAIAHDINLGFITTGGSAERHQVIASLKIGGGPDSVAFDATLHRIYSAGKSGKFDVVQQDGPDTYRVLDQISTHYGAHTLVVDPVSHQVFVGYASLFNHPRIAVFSPITPRP